MSDSDPDFDPDKLYDEKQKKYEQVELPFFLLLSVIVYKLNATKNHTRKNIAT